MNRKKWISLVVVCFMTIYSSAQMMRAFDVKANFRGDFGFGVGLTMNVVDELDFAPSYNYYFRSGTNAWHLDADMHYNFKPIPLWRIYPLAGITYYRCEKGRFGANLGAGCSYDFDMEWCVKAEMKYQVIKHWDDLFVSVGISYKF